MTPTPTEEERRLSRAFYRENFIADEWEERDIEALAVFRAEARREEATRWRREVTTLAAHACSKLYGPCGEDGYFCVPCAARDVLRRLRERAK